ncbi:MAG: cytochrome c-type biogenesis protein CcmH [Gammaproteobacteria bacterium]|jgi:cytochrome c-type biogenesis protein CcmH
MELFWIISAVLLLFVLASLVTALLRPGRGSAELGTNKLLHESRLTELRRDIEDQVIAEEELATATEEIDRALLDETGAGPRPSNAPNDAAKWLTVAVILVVVPAITFFTYFQLGEPDVALGNMPTQSEPDIAQQQIEDMLASLQQRLVDNPQDPEGWLLLGRSLLALGRYQEAATALAKTHELVGDIPQVLLHYADALAMANGGRITDQGRKLVLKTLEIEPDNITALWLAGLAAREAGENDQALAYLGHARGLRAATGSSTVELDQAIEEIQGAPVESIKPLSLATSIDVSVTVAPELISKIEPNATLFVFARTPNTGGPPLAVSRTTAASLPLSVTLDETMAMAPMFKLQAGQTVTVTARISKSGTPGATPGDLQGVSESLIVGDVKSIQVVINAIVE